MNLSPAYQLRLRAIRGVEPPAMKCALAFTLIELLVVISIIGVLAGLVVGLAGLAGRKGKESRVRAELAQIVTAIEAYKAKIGYYPPDNPRNPVTNQLFYELTGTYYDAKDKTFYIPNRQEAIQPTAVDAFFNAEGFANSVRDPREVRPFIDLKATQFQEISRTPDVELLVVPVPWPDKNSGPVPGTTMNPWRYVSTNPTNNPGRFDLWAEVMIGGKRQIIGNWKP